MRVYLNMPHLPFRDVQIFTSALKMRFVLLGRLAKPKAGSPLLASDRQGMCTLHAGVMLCIVCVTMLPDMADDSSTSTICLYLSPSQLCLIND